MRITVFSILLVVFSQFASAEEFIVRFVSSADKDTAERTIENHGFAVKGVISQLNMYVAEQTNKSADKGGLAKAAGVLYVEPNYERSIVAVPNDRNYYLQSGLKAIGAERAWDLQKGSRNVIVAVIDTGIYLSHSDLKHQLWINSGEIPNNGKDDDGNEFIDDVHGWDFINKDNSPNDDQSHGSHCAGIIGAETNNGVGIAGVAWNVQLMALKFLSARGSGSDSDGIRSIIYAVDNGAHIISASWGSTSYSQALEDAVRYASDRGVLMVVAAGNAKENNDRRGHYPSSYDVPNILSVGAASSTKRRADFSNYGQTRVHVAAPGVKVFSTINSKDSYGSKSGTSMATPMVAGVAALVLSANPHLSMADLRNAILNAVEPVSGWEGRNATNGFSRVDHALEQLAGGPQVWPKYLRLMKGSRHVMTAYKVNGARWSSGNPTVAEVSGSGEVVAEAAGVADIFVTDSNGQIHQAQIEVVEGNSPAGCSVPAQESIGAETSEAAMSWYLILLLLPLFLRRLLGRHRQNCCGVARKI